MIPSLKPTYHLFFRKYYPLKEMILFLQQMKFRFEPKHDREEAFFQNS